MIEEKSAPFEERKYFMTGPLWISISDDGTVYFKTEEGSFKITGEVEKSIGKLAVSHFHAGVARYKKILAEPRRERTPKKPALDIDLDLGI